jgi:cell division protein FtsB
VRLLKPLLLLCVVFYFGMNTLHGEHGVFALMRESRALKNYTHELETLRAERQQMERRVTHMRSDSLDLDLLDEQMRRMMGVAKSGELVVLGR